MRIVSKGEPPVERLFRGRCTSCQSVMEALALELKVEWDMREQGNFARAMCPMCKAEFILYPIKEKEADGG